jgi:hypothetical protein
MHAAAIRVEIRIPDAESLKAKRAAVRPLVEGLRKLASLSVSEVDNHDTWQRSTLGVALVTPDPASLENLVHRIRDYVEAHHEIEVVEFDLTYLETER